MPFYKKIGNFNSNTFKFSGNSETSEYDVANERLVQILRHLGELAELSCDVFGSVENECRKVFERTRALTMKVERCQKNVYELNAKTVIVPVGSLSEQQQVPTPTFLSSDAEKSPLFATFPRPPFVDRLRQLAYGPAPPALIPHCNLAPEADGRSSTTHIYCQPLKVPSSDESCTNVDGSLDRNMTSVIKVNSNVVPIDISGKSFSRMASFRRSLIHVDFLIRRKKKKDKRRNTLAEGETKDALNKFIANQNQYLDNSNSFPEQKFITASENFTKQEKVSDIVEKNNNTDSMKNSKYLTENDIEIKLEDKAIDSSRVESKYTDAAIKLPCSKRKSKSNIPISTISAAMSVAVEMRQSNGNKSDDHSSSGNWSCSSDQNSSDSDKKASLNSEPQKYLHVKENSKISENLNHCKERFKARSSLSNNKQKILSQEKYENQDPDVSSSTSSEIDKFLGDDITSINTSTESDAFFISSDESDEYLSDIPFSHEKYGSSTSLSTLSDRSLNSLLSQTGSEITSSTGTLTSIGEEKQLMPPPPPKTVAASILLEIKNEDVQVNLISKKCDSIKPVLIQNLSKKSKKLRTSNKQSQPLKEVSKKHLNLRENSKNIFTNLVSIKTNPKEKQKTQRLENKIQNKLNSQPSFDMYGSSSPKKPKELKVFTVENTQLQESCNIKVPMKSFSSHHSVAAKESIQSHPIPNSSNSLNQRTSWPQNVSESRLSVKTENEQSKYEHSIKVTPIQRCNGFENGGNNFTAFLRDNINNESQSPHNANIKNMRNERRNGINSEKNIDLNKAKPMCSISPLLEKPKAAAHVVLDFDGKVIYCTNSLDRKNHTPSVISNALNSKHPATVQDSALQNVKEATYRRPCSLQFMQPNSTSSFYSNGKSSVSKSNFYQKPTEENVIHSSMHNSWVPPSKDQQVFATTFSDNTILGERKEYTSKNSMSVMESNSHSANYSYADNKNFSNKYSMPPDPNISGLPDNENLLTQYNVNMHSKRMERLSLSPNESNTNNSFENKHLKPPPLHQNAVENHKKTAKQQSTISTEDLFAVIHSCKKRLNIKTDSEISLASSSRSSSPSYIRPSSSRGTLAETGFLSPRNPGCDSPGYRRSWADFRSSEGSERKSLASDRLGPTKPTSMHDFKMLLLQARSSNKSPGPRKSAVEMLKVSSPQDTSNRINELPFNLSPRNSISFPVQNSSPELYFSNGHSTVPFKRGNRSRSSLQTKYTIYPPIFEDCSEEYENCHDLNLQNHASKTLKEAETETSNNHLNTTATCNGGSIHSRHWI